MLRIEAIPYLMKIAAKIDLKPIINSLKGKDVDIYDEGTDEHGTPFKKLNKEKVGILGAEIIAEITPQFGAIASDFVPFVAAYKGMTVEDAKNLDTFEVINEIAHDEGIVSFFKSALRKAGKLTP